MPGPRCFNYIGRSHILFAFGDRCSPSRLHCLLAPSLPVRQLLELAAAVHRTRSLYGSVLNLSTPFASLVRKLHPRSCDFEIERVHCIRDPSFRVLLMCHVRLVVGLLDGYWQGLLQRVDRCKLASLSSSSFTGSSSDCASLDNGSVLACCCGKFLHPSCAKFLSTCSIVDLLVVRRCVIEFLERTFDLFAN